jgi:hypothetical protein
MKSTIETATPNLYPVLKRHVCDDKKCPLVVLFTAPCTGFVVSSLPSGGYSIGYPIGYCYASWLEEEFKELTGTITLSND